MNLATPVAAPVATEADVAALRVDLAAAFRLAARFDWHESVANHFSAAVSADGRRFLMNPRSRHFSAVRSSELLLLDADDPETMRRPDAPDPSAWAIHGAIHRARPDARVLLHAHPPHATALASLKEPGMPPIDQNTARFFGDLAVDAEFGGIADEEAEGDRIAAALGDRSTLLMGNHGVTCTGTSVAEAFETFYTFERAARTVVLALSTGRPLAVMPDALARKTAAGWRAYVGPAEAHFEHLKSELDRTDPSYRD